MWNEIATMSRNFLKEFNYCDYWFSNLHIEDYMIIS